MIITPCEDLPDYHDFDFARIGSFSLSTKTHKYVQKEDLVEHNGKTDTVSSHFRDYMQERDIPRKAGPIPITYAYFAYPSKWPHARYYDIKRAYHQIGKAFGAEVYISEGKACHYGDTRLNDSLFETQRVARGLLVSGTGERLSYEKWENGHLQTVSFANSLYAPHLRGAIQYTLHSIIWLMRNWIVYANTDGIIVPSVYYRRVEQFLDNWNVKYTVKHEGECVVKTRGTYKIGGFRTETFNLWPERYCDHVIESKPLWWMQKFQKGLELIE